MQRESQSLFLFSGILTLLICLQKGVVRVMKALLASVLKNIQE